VTNGRQIGSTVAGRISHWRISRCRSLLRRALARRTLTCGILAIFGAWPVCAPAADEVPAAVVPDTLRFVRADWRAMALGRQVDGAAGWVIASDGTLRLDLTVSDPMNDAAPEPGMALLARQGRGWTLITSADGAGVYGAWDREWQLPPAGLAELAFQIAALTASNGSGVSRTLTLAADPAVATAATAGVGRFGSFRQGLVTRGRGGGGPGERVSVRASADDDRVRIRSSRRPGWLEVLPRERLTVVGKAAEVFLPWWPLGDVLTFLPGSQPGTSGPDRR